MIVLKEKGAFGERETMFGESVCLWKDNLLIGSQYSSVPDINSKGTVFLYSTSTGELLHVFFPETLLVGFGASVCMNDEYIFIGAPESRRDVLSWQSDGAVCVYDAVTYELIDIIKQESPGSSSIYFGFSIAINSTKLAVGAHGYTIGGHSGAGRAYIYDIQTREYVTHIDNPLESASPAYSYFGKRVAMTDSFLAISADSEIIDGSNQGCVRIYNPNTAAFIKKLTTTDALKGNNKFGMRTRASGNTLIVSSNKTNSLGSRGTLIVWDDVLTAAAPIDVEPIDGSSDLTGIEISNNYILMAQMNDSSSTEFVVIYDRSTKAMLRVINQPSGIEELTMFGESWYSSAMSAYGNEIAIGAPMERRNTTDPDGACYIFDMVTGDQKKYIPNPNVYGESSFDLFGLEIAAGNGRLAISTGETGIANAYMRGSVFLYNTNDMSLIKEIKDNAPTGYPDYNDDNTMTALAIDGQILVIGSPYKYHDEEIYDAGVVNIYSQIDGSHIATITKEGEAAPEDLFGYSVALTNNYLAIGTPWNNVEGNASGSVFIYDKSTFAYVRTIDDPDPNEENEFGANIKHYVGDKIIIGSPGNSVDDPNFGKIYLADAATGEIDAFDVSIDVEYAALGKVFAVSGGKIFAVAQTEALDEVSENTVLIIDIETGNLQKTLSRKKKTSELSTFAMAIEADASCLIVSEQTTTFESEEMTSVMGMAVTVYVYDMNNDYSEIQAIKNPNHFNSIAEQLNPEVSGDMDGFGSSIVKDQDYIYISAPNESSEKGVMSGVVYAFKKNKGTFDNERITVCKPVASNMSLGTAKLFTTEFETLYEGMWSIREKMKRQASDFLIKERAFNAFVAILEDNFELFIAAQEVTSESLKDAMVAFKNLSDGVNLNAGQTINLFDIKSADFSRMTDEYKQQIIALSAIADGLSIIGKLVSEEMKSLKGGDDAVKMLASIFTMIKKKLFVTLKTINDKYNQIDELFTVISDAAYILEKAISSNKTIEAIFNMPEQERTAFFNERYY